MRRHVIFCLDLFYIKERYKVDVDLQTRKHKGELPYLQWLCAVRSDLINRMEESDPKRFLMSATKHLKIYNNCMVINKESRALDALNYLKRKFEKRLALNEHVTQENLTNLRQGKISNSLKLHFSINM